MALWMVSSDGESMSDHDRRGLAPLVVEEERPQEEQHCEHFSPPDDIEADLVYFSSKKRRRCFSRSVSW